MVPRSHPLPCHRRRCHCRASRGVGLLPLLSIEEEKYVVTDTFLSYGLHMTRSESDHMFHVLRVSHVLLKTGGEQKLVVWSWSDARIIA